MARCKWALLSLMTIALWCSSCCDAATIASSFLKAAQQKLAPNSAKSSNRMAAFGFSPSSPLAAYWKQRVASLSSSMGWSMVDYNFTKPQAAGPASTLAIAFLSRQDFLGDGWLTKLQSCLDLCGGETGCSPSIVFLVEGRNESGVARAEQAVMELANTSAAGGLLKVEWVYLEGSDESRILSSLSDTLSCAQSSSRSSRPAFGFSPPRILAPSASSQQAHDMHRVRVVAAHFLKIFESELASVDYHLLIGKRDPMAALAQALDASCERHSALASDFRRDSDAWELARSEVKAKLASKLHDVVDRMLESVQSSLLAEARQDLTRMETPAECSALLETANRKLRRVLGEMEEQLSRILGKERGDAIVAPSLRTAVTVDTSFRMRIFHSSLLEEIDGHLKRMQLLGAYNPYIRTQAFPPTHINVNYLLNPRKCVDKRLYDEHVAGVCERRAYPMRFPGVAYLPFDPDESPALKRPATSWRQALWDRLGR